MVAATPNCTSRATRAFREFSARWRKSAVLECALNRRRSSSIPACRTSGPDPCQSLVEQVQHFDRQLWIDYDGRTGRSVDDRVKDVDDRRSGESLPPVNDS